MRDILGKSWTALLIVLACACVRPSLTEATQPTDFAIIGKSSVTIGSGSSIVPGAGGTGIWSGGSLDLGKQTRCGGIQALGDIAVGEKDKIRGGVTGEGEVKIAGHVLVDGSVISGRNAVIGRNTRVSGDVIAGGTITLQAGATVSGKVLERDDPESAVSIAFPRIPAFAPDGRDLNTERRTVHTIPPGVYRDYMFGEQNKVVFSTGTYTFRDLVFGPQTRIEFNLSEGPIRICIAGKMIFGERVRTDIIGGNPEAVTYILAPGTEVTAQDGSAVVGTLFGPDAEIELQKGVLLKGAMAVNRIRVGPRTKIESHPASFSPPRASFSVNPEKIVLGEMATLIWNSADALSVSIDNDIGVVDVSGSLVVSPVKTTTYTLTAAGPGGEAERSVCLAVEWPPPEVEVSANPASIQPGESSIISWKSQHSDRVEIDQGIGEVLSEGSVVVYPIETTTYTIVATGSEESVFDAVTVTVDNPIPPDPRDIAPKLDRTGITPFAESVAFLYRGENAIQTGVAENTIEPRRAAVVRGRVMNADGQPLPGATVSVLNHKEFGETHSRIDGLFDLVVNGGGPLTLVYRMDGCLVVQRRVQVPWRDYVWVDDVTLIPWDEEVTSVDLADSSIPIQVARGGIVGDADGARQATILFPRGTKAEAVMPDGTVEPLTSLHVRATEYTVSETGPSAMPGDLPQASAYTYCVELSVDEAADAGATAVRFSQPVLFYVENFLGFPVGSAVPTGYYDRSRGVWVPSDNGRVIQILNVDAGLAEVDIDGDGYADDDGALAELGVTGAELGQLADLYEEGQSLWRVAIPHFTPWDCNWPYGLPPGATAPEVPEASNMPLDNPDILCGSVIEAQNQTLGESIGVVGAPFRLHYRSDRVPGRKDAYTLKIPLSGDSVAETLSRIKVRIEIAGQLFTDSLEPAANLTYTFAWDGFDAYGRMLQGRHPATVSVGYMYRPFYYSVPSGAPQSFGQVPEDITYTVEWRMPQCMGGGGCSSVLEGIALWQTYEVVLGGWDASEQGLGGWAVTMHHVYDPIGQTLMLGDGRRLTATELGDIITTIAGTGSPGYSGDGLPALQAQIGYTYDIAAGPDGSIFITDYRNSSVRRIDPDGIITRVAGTGAFGYSGDGGPAVEAQIGQPYGVAVGPDGSLYFSDSSNNCVRKVDRLGIITTVAGNGSRGYSGDGGPAIEAQLNKPRGIAVDDEGTLYIADSENHRIRKVKTDGIIITLAGNGCEATSGDGGLAVDACIASPIDVVVGAQAVFIAENHGFVVRRVGSDGKITTFAGCGGRIGPPKDGGPATQTFLFPWGLALDPAGNLYVVDGFAERVRVVGGNGVITTFAGGGDDLESDVADEGGLATQARLWAPRGIAVGPNGNLYISEVGVSLVRRVTSGFPDIVSPGLEFISVPSQDGRQVFVFNGNGRHLYTLDSVTGAVIYEFLYDDRNLLERMIDGNGNTFTFERDPNGRPLAIESPGGSRTGLSLDANGYLSAVTDPVGHVIRMGYGEGGLLADKIDERGFIQQYVYDALGRLIRDEEPSGGYKALSRRDQNQAFDVSVTTAMQRETRYLVERDVTGVRLRTVIRPDGTVEETLTDRLGNSTVTSPDGSVTTFRQGPDPRFGMLAPLPESITVTTPGGISTHAELRRTVTLQDRGDLFSIIEGADELDINGRMYYSQLYPAAGITVYTTPEGRQRTVWRNALGQITSDRFAGLHPVQFTYDAKGRISAVSQGTGTDAREIDFSYDPQGFLNSITDSSGRTATLEHDGNGRVTRQILSDGREILYQYDGSGNLLSLTPPGRSAHVFSYGSTSFLENYIPPASPGSGRTEYNYNLDAQLISISRPDGKQLDFDYRDCCGHLDSVTMPRGKITFDYDSSTGKLAHITAPDGSLTYTYDGPLLLTETWSGDVAGSVSRTYDSNLWITSLGTNTETLHFAYDSDGLLRQAGDLSITRRAEDGLISETTLGAISDARIYNSFGEVEAYGANAEGNADLLYGAHYERDQMGRIVEKTETIEGAITSYTYWYDQGGRLTGLSADGMPVAKYTYDENGNRLSRSDASEMVLGDYDAQDRLLYYGDTTYSYSANGELFAKTENGEVTTYEYDVLGYLMAVTFPDGHRIDYLVDGRNRRIGKKVDGVLIQGFLYQDRLNPVAELDGFGNVISRFVYATWPNVPDYMIKDGTTYRMISDHLGSPRLVINGATGEIVQRMDYDVFGRIILDTNPGFQPFGFAGGLNDSDTGLVRFGMRDYDPKTGRWTAKDPILFAGGDTNLYAYVLNDPVNLVDPAGLAWLRQDGQSYLAGRKGSIVEPGEGVGAFIDDCVPAGHTFAQRHDDFVGLMQDLRVPDPLINVPSMPIFYLEAVIEEIIKTPFRAMHLLFPDNDPCGK